MKRVGKARIVALLVFAMLLEPVVVLYDHVFDAVQNPDTHGISQCVGHTQIPYSTKHCVSSRYRHTYFRLFAPFMQSGAVIAPVVNLSRGTLSEWTDTLRSQEVPKHIDHPPIAA